ncbi:MAG: hypothetical protein PUB19_06100 [Lachnospiraceae bacterium]|nr:hypothetical protein [Lachnospiraceae bacterium]
MNINISAKQVDSIFRTRERESSLNKSSMTQETKTLLRDLNRTGFQEKKDVFSNRIWESNQQYATSLREARIKNSKTLTELKKLRYNFKAISAQILRSKTSTAAKAAVGKARAEVVRLKRLRQSGQYDEEELQYAIAHAMAMERVAKKKAKHLQEEEMIHVKEKSESSAENSSGNTVDDLEDVALIQAEEGISEEFDIGEILDLMDVSQFQSEMGDLMMSLLEDMDWMEAVTDTLSDLLEGYETEMSPEDFKMLKIKHRNKEMRQIVEADAEYLKAVFDTLQSEQSGGISGTVDIMV